MIVKSSLFKTTIILLFYLIPFLFLVFIVTKFSVNVPYWDQWELVGLFDKFATNTASFGDFFSQHNEHRITFPRIISVGLAFLSNWNIKYELYFSIFLAAISFFALHKLPSLKNQERDQLWILTNILTCILIFSLVQHENWFWGFQLAWFLINTCLITCVLIITLSNYYSQSFYLAAIPCFIASFSSAHGLLTWLAVIPSIACIRGNYKQKALRVITWVLLFFTTCSIYFIGYHKPSHHPSTLFFLKKPLFAANYFFTLLGTPLEDKAIIASIIGLILFLTFLYLTLNTIFIKPKSKSQINNIEAFSWISIGLFALLFAFITTVGRAGFGIIEQAMASRYTTSSILLIIATAQLWRLYFQKNSFFAGILIGLLLVNSVDVISQVTTLRLQRQASATCLELINFIDDSPDSCLVGLYPSTTRVKELARVLERLNFRKFPKNIAFITQPVKIHGYVDAPSTQENSLTVSKKGSLNTAGWAILPDTQKLPKIVLFSYASQRSFFASTVVNLDSPDVAKALKSNQYNKVRWFASISPKKLPLGDTVLKAWVYNPVDQQFIQLNGEPELKVVE